MAAPSRGDHIVQLYPAEERLLEAVTVFAGQGLGRGEAVVLVATGPHLRSFETRLDAAGFAVEYLKQARQLVLADAEKTLLRLLVDGLPDAALFREVAGSLLAQVGSFPRVRVFGEMVELLWRERLPAAVRLEELWNRLLEVQPITLFCAYAIGPESEDRARFPGSLKALHRHVLPAAAATAAAPTPPAEPAGSPAAGQ